MNRNKKLRLIQTSLFLLGVSIIFFTYKDNSDLSKDNVISMTDRSKNAKE